MRFHATLLLVALALVPAIAQAAPSELRLEGFAFDLPGAELDDAVWIRNLGARPVPLDDVTLADGTGRIGFPPSFHIGAGATVVVAGNATAYTLAAGVEPDLAVQGLSPERTAPIVVPRFALSQEGDVVLLEQNGTVLDALVYGASSAPPSGWSGPAIPIRGGTFLRWYPRIEPDDHDEARDWVSLRRHLLGQDRTGPLRLTATGPLRAYMAPDRIGGVWEEAIAASQRSLRINVYDFRDLDLADRIVGRIRQAPGLAVDVLLDDLPVGHGLEQRSERGHVVDRLTDAGARVRFLTHHRYGYDHAKYAVVDERFVLVQTENLVPSGLGRDMGTGNRGWGVWIESALLAQRLTELFDGDFRLDPYGARNPEAADGPTFAPPLHVPSENGAIFDVASAAGPANVTMIVSPSGTLGRDDPVLDALTRANRTIRVVQLNLPLYWNDASGTAHPNGYLEALRAAARRGVHVRILLDGHFLDDEGGLDNADTVAALASDATLALLEARLWSADDGGVLHAKGFVIDDRLALVGSMNWNLHSIAQNREVSLLVDDPTIGSHFARVFDHDWGRTEEPGRAIPHVPLHATMITLLLLIGLRPPRRSPG